MCFSRWLTFSLLLLVFTAMPAAPKHGIEGREVSFRNGDLQLAGLWYLPEGEGPFPAAVFIRGSGDSTRDSHWAQCILETVLSAGVAVLLPDKRGSGHSEGDWRTASFHDLAGDAVSAVQFVREQPGVHRDKVGLVGLSQGGKIAPIAAARFDDVAFVIDIVGSATTVAEQISWEMYHTFRESGLTGAELQQALVLQVTAEEFVRGSVEWETFRARLDKALESGWSHAAEGFPDALDDWRWRFFRQIHGFDPLPFWHRVRAPVLILHGEDDHNAPTIRSAYRLIRTFLESDHPDWTIRILPQTGHGLWRPESMHSHHPQLHPEAVSILKDWLKRITRMNAHGT